MAIDDDALKSSSSSVFAPSRSTPAATSRSTVFGSLASHAVSVTYCPFTRTRTW
jgi:hypothetical protein